MEEKVPQEVTSSQDNSFPHITHHRNRKWLIGMLVILILLVLTGGIYANIKNSRTNGVKPTTENRQPFDSAQGKPTTDTSPTPTNNLQPTTSDVEMINWQMYRNEEHGFEFKYQSRDDLNMLDCSKSINPRSQENSYYPTMKAYVKVKVRGG